MEKQKQNLRSFFFQNICGFLFMFSNKTFLEVVSTRNGDYL